MRLELARLAVLTAILGASVALSVSCAPHWQGDEILGATVTFPDDGPRPVRIVARAIYDASEASPDPRLLRDARIVILATQAETNGYCLSPAHGCWHPDYDDEGGAGTIYVGPPGDGGQVAESVIRHELGHLARWRWKGDSDAEHKDTEWWIRFDSPATRCD